MTLRRIAAIKYPGKTCDDCSQQVDECPNDCSGHGLCGTGGLCRCAPGFVGDDCGRPTSCSTNCSNHGLCVDDEVCECKPGWEGDDCAKPKPCPYDCSNHGICSNGKCLCDSSYKGDWCQHLRRRAEHH